MLKSLGPRTVTISPGGPCLQRVLIKAKKKKKKLFPEKKHDEAILVCLHGVDWLICALRWTDNLEQVV